MPLTTGTTFGSYELLSPLGIGGMGEVYLARQTTLDRQVAIKVLPPQSTTDPERLRRFEQEARAASSLNHPNIISIYDIGYADSIAYIAMEFVDGRTLRSLLDSGPIPLKRTLHIATQIADGLARAHAAGIVHRDLKPENIMVTRDNLVKILDFGLAKLQKQPEDLSLSATRTADSTPGIALGTPAYMSPEQARGEPLDFRSDIFSFGCLLYEMVANKPPFSGASVAQILSDIIEDDPPPLREANPKAPIQLCWIVERCLAKSPDDRYSSTYDLAHDLRSIRDHLSDLTISGPVAPAALTRKPTRLSSFAALLLGGIALGALLMFFLRPASDLATPTFHSLTFSGTDFSPTVSPDGRTVAFVSGRDGSFRIWLKQLESGSETVLTAGPDDASPRFSPDGAWIMFIHNHAAYRIPSFGGEPSKLLDNVEDAGWSPDGRQIAFIRFLGADSQLGVATLSSGETKVLHLFENSFFQCPSWSPDGSTIALIRKTTGTAAAVFPAFTFVSADGRDARQVTSPLRGGELSTATWIDGSRRLLYAIPESQGDIGTMQTTIVGSPARIVMQNVKTGDIHPIFSVQSPVSRVEIAGNNRLIFDLLGQRDNLKLFSVAGADVQGRWLTHGNSIDRQPFFSPDGESILFTSSRAGDVDIWEVSLKTNALHRLTDNPASDWDPFITPDNKHIVWSSNRTGNFEIWIADRDGAAPRQLSHDGYDAENPIVTADGWVLYSSGNPQHPGLWKMRLDGSSAQVLVPRPIAWPDASPDGKYAIYHLIGNALSGQIHVIRISDGTPVDFQAAGQRARFSGDGRSIVYIVPYGHGIARQEFPAAPNSHVQLLVPETPDQFIDSFHISRDGKQVIATFAQPSRSIVVADGVPGIKAPTR